MVGQGRVPEHPGGCCRLLVASGSSAKVLAPASPVLLCDLGLVPRRQWNCRTLETLPSHLCCPLGHPGRLWLTLLLFFCLQAPGPCAAS